MKTATPKDSQNPQTKVGVIKSLRGLMVEVDMLGERPEEKELLSVDEHPEVFLEVSFFKSGAAICINLTNSQVLRCGQTVRRTLSLIHISEPTRQAEISYA